MPSFFRRKAEPKNVASIVLGGGPGTQLFPLTQRSATPAVSEYVGNIIMFFFFLFSFLFLIDNEEFIVNI